MIPHLKWIKSSKTCNCLFFELDMDKPHLEKHIMNKLELIKLQNYLQKLFKNKDINVRVRPNQSDSLEVYMDEEYIGLIYKDDDEGEISYDFQMAILDFDLE